MAETGTIVAVAQLALAVGELDANRKAASAAVAEAAAAGARVRIAALSGADLIAAPVNWNAPGSPIPPGERSGEVVSAQAAASTNGVFIAVADRCGSERGVDWLGGSVILRRGGYPSAGPVCQDRPAVLTASLDLKLARNKRISELNDLFTDRRLDLYTRLSDVLQKSPRP
jgi:predicted amidohydrolase